MLKKFLLFIALWLTCYVFASILSGFYAPSFSCFFIDTSMFKYNQNVLDYCTNNNAILALASFALAATLAYFLRNKKKAAKSR